MTDGESEAPLPLLDPADLLCLTDQQVSAELTGETVILSMRDGVYYGLDEVGTFVWQRMREPVPFCALVAAVVASFDVDETRARGDLSALVRDLTARGLVEIRPAGPA